MDGELVLEDNQVGVAQGGEIVKGEFRIHEAVEDGIEPRDVFGMAAQFFLVQADADPQAFIMGRHVEIGPEAVVVKIEEFPVDDEFLLSRQGREFFLE